MYESKGILQPHDAWLPLLWDYDLPLAKSEQSVRLKTVLSSYLLLRLKESLSLKAFGLKIPGQVKTIRMRRIG